MRSRVPRPDASRPDASRPDASRPDASNTLRNQVFAVLESLKPGEVLSYADVAERAGYPRAARAAGAALASCPETLPWWRVVYGNGFLPRCNPSLQAERLAEEGVLLEGFRVVAAPLGRFAPKPKTSPRSKRP